MKIYKLHTPDGTYDVMPGELKQKREAERCIMNTFEEAGYLEIETPSFEYVDVFKASSESISEENMFKFFDKDGKTLALRPDITTSAARLATTKFSDTDLPLRLSYIGHAFRNNDTVYGVQIKEFTQAGIELYGDPSPAADAEIISATIKALLATGLSDFQIEIGHAGLFKGLMNYAGIDDANAEKLREFIDIKDSFSLTELLASIDIPADAKNLISELPYMFGDIDILDKYTFPEGEAQSAISSLKIICDTLCREGYEKYISVDLGMVKRLDYYTGTIFNGFTRHMGYSVCGGGRYDNLCAEFGKPYPATGVAIGIDRLLTALYRRERK